MTSDAERRALVGTVRRLMAADYDGEAEGDALLRHFTSRVPHPRASDLIFWPDKEFDHEPTAEEIVERALAYRAIEL